MDELVFFYPEGHEKHSERGHPERPERVEAIRVALQKEGIWDRYSKLASFKLSDTIYKTVHSAAYLNLLELTCRRGGHLDMDTYTTPATWDLAHRAAGGGAAIASHVWEGKAKRGFAITRPPGHHATHGQGMGFCVLNNVAIAAKYLLQVYKINKLAIVDLDLHHGNGTQDIFWTSDEVFYLSTHQFPFYPGSGGLQDIGEGAGEGWTANFPLPAGSGDVAFTAVMEGLILPLLDQRQPQMILVSYGFDPHWMDPLGQLMLTANTYGKLIRSLCCWADKNCEGKIVLFLEGGYDLNAARACSLAVVDALLGRPWEDPFPCPYEESNSWRSMLAHAHEIWQL
jgi:acetoin utilization deacetylase AcuC-like enzyme